MKIELKTGADGASEITLSEVYSGVGIQTDAGLFGIAERDGGIEVMLNGKTVWALGADTEDLPVTLPPPAPEKMSETDMTRTAAAIDRITAKVGPMLRKEEHLAAAMALTSMAAHHVLHDGAGEADFMAVCRAAWEKTVKVHSGCKN